jgi:hypothetical protein
MWGSIPAACFPCPALMDCINQLLLQQFLSFFSNAGEFNHMLIEVSLFIPITGNIIRAGKTISL